MRGSPEPGADLISRGQLFAMHIWQRAGAVPPPPAWPGVTFQECWQCLAHLQRVSGGSRRPLRRLARGWGWAPPCPDFLAPPSSGCRCGSRAGPPLGRGMERAVGCGFLPWGGRPRDQLLGPHCREGETEARAARLPCGAAVVGQMVILALTSHRSGLSLMEPTAVHYHTPCGIVLAGSSPLAGWARSSRA